MLRTSRTFLRIATRAKPFFFWLGTSEPHQRYDVGAWKSAGKRLEDARLPGALPDHPEVRGEILDYGLEIEHFDRHLGRALATLEAAGVLDNTLVIVTSDHGNPLPRSKCNLYDSGIQVPLAARLPGAIPGGRDVDDLASLVDIGPQPSSTPYPSAFRTKCQVGACGRSCSRRNRAWWMTRGTSLWRHSSAIRSPVGVAWATRCARFAHTTTRTSATTRPDRWPAGDPDYNAPPQGFFGDVDRGATKTFLMANALEPAIRPYYLMAYGRRPAEELYDLRKDPDQLRNIRFGSSPDRDQAEPGVAVERIPPGARRSAPTRCQPLGFVPVHQSLAIAAEPQMENRGHRFAAARVGWVSVVWTLSCQRPPNAPLGGSRLPT